MITRSAADLVADARSRADLRSQFRTDAQIRYYLTQSARLLARRLIREHECNWFDAEDVIVTDPGVGYSSLPPGTHLVRWFRVTLDGKRDNIPRANTEDIDIDVSSFGWSGTTWPKHRIVHGSVHWVPAPTAAHEVTVALATFAIFRTAGGFPAVDLASATHTFAAPMAFDEAVVLDTAIKLVRDREKDATPLMAEFSDRWREIVADASPVVSSEPLRVRDTYRAGQYTGRGEPWR